MQLAEVLSRECKDVDCPEQLRKAEHALGQEQNVAAQMRQESLELQHLLQNAQEQLRNLSTVMRHVNEGRYLAEARRLENFKEAEL
jgi:hypothetical protein